MTQKERLLQLLYKHSLFDDDVFGREIVDSVADLLLENGVIVPPCKVGSCIYLISKNSSVPAVTRIDNVLFDGDAFQYNMDDDMFFDFSEGDIGKTAFATYKQAEKALKERESNGNV